MTFQQQKLLLPEQPEVALLNEVVRLISAGETEAAKQLCMRRLIGIESITRLVDYDPVRERECI